MRGGTGIPTFKDMLITRQRQHISSPRDIARILRQILDAAGDLDRDKEHFWVVNLDTKYHTKSVHLVHLGELDLSHGLTLDVASGEFDRLLGCFGPTSSLAALVDEPSMGYDEHPGSKSGLVALELVDIAGRLEEGFGGEIIRFLGAPDSQVSGHWTDQ